LQIIISDMHYTNPSREKNAKRASCIVVLRGTASTSQ
jgi:hypothetical protein